jgi:hypothetical protein
MPRERHHSPSKRLSVVSEGVARGEPVTRIYGEDGSYILLDEDCPESGDDYTGELTVVCLDCLLDQRPEVGRGLDIAKRHHAAHRDEAGDWIGGEAA